MQTVDAHGRARYDAVDGMGAEESRRVVVEESRLRRRAVRRVGRVDGRVGMGGLEGRSHRRGRVHRREGPVRDHGRLQGGEAEVLLERAGRGDDGIVVERKRVELVGNTGVAGHVGVEERRTMVLVMKMMMGGYGGGARWRGERVGVDIDVGLRLGLTVEAALGIAGHHDGPDGGQLRREVGRPLQGLFSYNRSALSAYRAVRARRRRSRRDGDPRPRRRRRRR